MDELSSISAHSNIRLSNFTLSDTGAILGICLPLSYKKEQKKVPWVLLSLIIITGHGVFFFGSRLVRQPFTPFSHSQYRLAGEAVIP
jgi:hypothetical protein